MNKKNFYGALAVLLFTSFAALSSCKKEKNDPKEEVTNNGTAKAVVKYGDKTVNFSSGKNNYEAYMDWTADDQENNFALTLQDKASGMIIVMMVYPVKDGPGTYPLEGFSAETWSSANVYVKGESSKKEDIYNFVWISHDGELPESKGTVTITSITEKNVKGTFSATLHSYYPDTKLAEKLTISGGSFDVPLKRREFDLKNYE